MRAVTSSSNLLRRKLCAGSARMEAELPEQESAYSAEGTMLHPIFGTGNRPPYLTEEQCAALDCADRETEQFFKSFAEQMEISPDEPFTDIREHAVEFRGKRGVTYPGHADFVRIWPGRDLAAIVDAKFGFADVDDAAQNLQLVSYAAMLQQVCRYNYVGVCIVQPRNFGKKSSMAIYSADALLLAEAEIENIVLASQDPDAPLSPSEDACRYCKAKPNCSALTDRALSVQTSGELTAATAAKGMLTLTDNRLGYLMDSIKLAKMLEPYAKGEILKRIIEDGMDEWGTKPGAIQKHVDDTLAAFAALVAEVPELTEAEYMAACTLSLDALKKPVAAHKKILQSKAAELILRTLEPLITRKQNAPSIVRKEKA